MNLSVLLNELEYELVQGDKNLEINKIEYDSRKISNGDVFVCIKGFNTDGHKYAQKAVNQGALALVCEDDLQFGVPGNITVIKVSDTRDALARLAVNYYDNPSKKLNLIGVTGTNGKTTTTFLIKSVLDNLGKKVGIIGTIENRIGDKVIHAERTTPESTEVQALFSEMLREGVTDTIMEVSSHSLSLKRVAYCNFETAIFTNLTQDHLDYHKTMQNYMEAKGILFEMAKNAVINIDDEAGKYMIEKARGKNILTTGINNKADITAKNIEISADGVVFDMEYLGKIYPVSLNIPGKFSIYNALGAIGACIFMGIDIKDILEGLKQNKGVKGRFQTVKSHLGFNAIVDYAHTPDGLLNILNTAKEFAKGRIITVFGCGGDRDRTKRPIMAEVVGKLSDFAIITSDNPRTEDPARILDDVETGIVDTKCEYTKIQDRREAIIFAVNMAKKDDLIVIAGKGHEDYQIFADKTIHFDDVEEVTNAFSEREKRENK